MLADFSAMLDRSHWLVMDIKTTGLYRPAEICELAIVQGNGKILLDTLLHTKRPISSESTAIHGISNDMVKGAKNWPAVKGEMIDIITGMDVVVYNAEFERKLMRWTDEQYGIANFNYHFVATWHCAMEAYAEWYGAPNSLSGSYMWQRLTSAMIQQGLPVLDEHRAVASCLMTAMLCQYMDQNRHGITGRAK